MVSFLVFPIFFICYVPGQVGGHTKHVPPYARSMIGGRCEQHIPVITETA